MKNFFYILLMLTMPVAAQTIQTNIEHSVPDNRYVVHNDGTVTDTATGLMWKQCSEGQIWNDGTCNGTATTHNFETAHALASEANDGDYYDWRLPNVKELASLVAENRNDPAINLTIFPDTFSSYFWSSSPYGNDGASSWIVDFYGGVDGNDSRTNANYVRLVRAGE
ncbi:MAG: DUF1566 domain-containing protein [Oleibacter sp.]|nr:DUF1566 domain-containing protein [Thalassolituus sp.]